MCGIDCASISVDENDLGGMSEEDLNHFDNDSYQVNIQLEEEREFIEAIPKTCLVIDLD